MWDADLVTVRLLSGRVVLKDVDPWNLDCKVRKRLENVMKIECPRPTDDELLTGVAKGLLHYVGEFHLSCTQHHLCGQTNLYVVLSSDAFFYLSDEEVSELKNRYYEEYIERVCGDLSGGENGYD